MDKAVENPVSWIYLLRDLVDGSYGDALGQLSHPYPVSLFYGRFLCSIKAHLWLDARDL